MENYEKVLAVYSDSAQTGFKLMGIVYDIDDYAIIEPFGYSNSKKTRNKIYTELKTGRTYVKKFGRKLYLDEFLKV